MCWLSICVFHMFRPPAWDSDLECLFRSTVYYHLLTGLLLLLLTSWLNIMASSSNPNLQRLDPPVTIPIFITSLNGTWILATRPMLTRTLSLEKNMLCMISVAVNFGWRVRGIFKALYRRHWGWGWSSTGTETSRFCIYNLLFETGFTLQKKTFLGYFFFSLSILIEGKWNYSRPKYKACQWWEVSHIRNPSKGPRALVAITNQHRGNFGSSQPWHSASSHLLSSSASSTEHICLA